MLRHPLATIHCNTRNTLQHTATHCNKESRFDMTFALLDIAAPSTYCSTLQLIATHCNTMQHTATHCNTLQHTATHCNALQHTATHCNTESRFDMTLHQETLLRPPLTATHCISLHQTTSHCNTLQPSNHSATHCNTVQHNATHCNTESRFDMTLH